MRRLLEVSGNESVREGIKLACQKLGLEVVTAVNGDEALRLYRSNGPFDFVLTDPEWLGQTTRIKDAFELASLIHRKSPTQKIALHSSRSRQDFPAGKTSHLPILQKPISSVKQVEVFLASL
jgi:CheY-like chemotaxis protein